MLGWFLPENHLKVESSMDAEDEDYYNFYLLECKSKHWKYQKPRSQAHIPQVIIGPPYCGLLVQTLMWLVMHLKQPDCFIEHIWPNSPNREILPNPCKLDLVKTEKLSACSFHAEQNGDGIAWVQLLTIDWCKNISAENVQCTIDASNPCSNRQNNCEHAKLLHSPVFYLPL